MHLEFLGTFLFKVMEIEILALYFFVFAHFRKEIGKLQSIRLSEVRNHAVPILPIRKMITK